MKTTIGPEIQKKKNKAKANRKLVQNKSEKDDKVSGRKKEPCLVLSKDSGNCEKNRKSSYIKGLIKLDLPLKMEIQENPNPALIKRGINSLNLNIESVQLDDEIIKKAKNRESAKNSRQRKRVYIKLLEEKFAIQDQIIFELKAQIDSLKYGWNPMIDEEWNRPLLPLQWTQRIENKNEINNEIEKLLTTFHV